MAGSAWPALRHIERAMAQVSKASGKLREAGKASDDYYHLNRIWAQLESMARRMRALGRPDPKGEVKP